MAKIIEIAGPAGVGKTTILNSLLKSWQENFPWIHNQKLFPYQKIDFLNLTSLASNLPNLIKNGKTSLDHRLLYDVGRNFITENGAYVDAYWNSLHINYSRDLNGFDGRFDSAAKFYSKIQKYQFIKEHQTTKYVLFDEGLVHDLGGRVPIHQNSLQKSFEDIHTLLPFMPLPAMLILIDTDIDIILKRLNARTKVLQMHKEKSEKELLELTQIVKSRFGYIKNQLLEKNIPVLLIDANENVESNTIKINQFLKQISAHQPA